VKRCAICGTDLSKDLFASAMPSPVCCVCTVKYVGSRDTPARIATVRAALGLADGAYLQQDNGKEAARILGRSW
jgi:hypothetical protein